MISIYSAPLRVYTLLALLGLAGLVASTQLPVSLFPNSSKPEIGVNLSTGTYTAASFLETFGRDIEDQLRTISAAGVEVERVQATYDSSNVSYRAEFKWGNSPQSAKREVENIIHSFSGRFPEDVRQSIGIWTANQNSGFFALSFYSDTKTLDETYKILDSILAPRLTEVKDAQNPVIWNPAEKEIRVELDPKVITTLQIYPRELQSAVAQSILGRRAGSLTLDTRDLSIQVPAQLQSPQDFANLLIPLPSGRAVPLSELARVELAPRSQNSYIFKTSGTPSLILFSRPQPGGNVKRMSEELLAKVREVGPQLPRDIHYKVLVDPSEFIRAATQNVLHEVGIAALLAVSILFLFIGSFRNTITAAIEIPLSMILAFILMRLSGMNLNLISLGGLALSAGMNVDASVVVMENIFRHLEMHPDHHRFSFAEKARIVATAVREVRFPVVASTIASLVVFLPLAFTSQLTYAILGDLAKAVVFSHGLSAIIALILVPTIRLHLMSKGKEKPFRSPIAFALQKLESGYATSLGWYLRRPWIQWGSISVLVGLLVALITLVAPRLPKEVIGRPDTDWMVVSASTQGNTLTRQMEGTAEQVEAEMLKHFGNDISYTFSEIEGPNSAWIMGRLRNKKRMDVIWKEMEKLFPNTPFFNYWVGPWNPSELPIPRPPKLKILVRGGESKSRAEAALELSRLLEENKVFPRIQVNPNVQRQEGILIDPIPERWIALAREGARFNISDISDLSLVATSGMSLGWIPIQGRRTAVVLRYPQGTLKSPEELESLPIRVGERLVPLKALANISRKEVEPAIFRENKKELFVITGEELHDEKSNTQDGVNRAHQLVDQWTKQQKNDVSVFFDDPQKELTEALDQLKWAAALSVLLIFITMVIQFGDIGNSVLVLVAIPLGLIGVLSSLSIFGSTLSLNSALGVILLNGISVANSIILVDFLKRLVESGMPPLQAAVEAGRKRLRPILMTSLTTVLGMLPIALGVGEGGKVLQPLGIAVAGGLWVSMLLTLFLVPSLQVAYLGLRSKKAHAQQISGPPEFKPGLTRADQPATPAKEVSV